MKKLVLLALITSISVTAFSQIQWHNNLKVAQAMALEKDQLILMDFWATWCGPCKKMDKELWSDQEVAKLSQNFVPLKVDVDINRSMAMDYDATSIPKVILATADGEVIWEQTGFSGAYSYIETFKQIPTSLNGLNKLLFTEKGKESLQNQFEIALAFQKLGMEMNNKLGKEFLDESDSYFKHVEKKSEDQPMVAMAELNQLFNDALRGRYKKAIKKVDKIDYSNDSAVQEFSAFIKAFCYKCKGDRQNYMEAKKSVKDKKYLTKLEVVKQ